MYLNLSQSLFQVFLKEYKNDLDITHIENFNVNSISESKNKIKMSLSYNCISLGKKYRCNSTFK